MTVTCILYKAAKHEITIPKAKHKTKWMLSNTWQLHAFSKMKPVLRFIHYKGSIKSDACSNSTMCVIGFMYSLQHTHWPYHDDLHHIIPPCLLITTLNTTVTPMVTPSSFPTARWPLSPALYRPVQLTNRCPTQIINCVHPQVALGRLICTLQEPCLIAFSAGWLKPSHKSLVLLTLNWAIRPGMASTTAIHTGPHTKCLYFSSLCFTR